ncbi:ImmA/IrrE family metallo-endopeptidase [Bacillus altitudinis]|uniref:ImmA/IrrE family metallo-endopeptidase n=1 Tax=Bacillus altitudinis TaxID=293387 RepID=UPI0038B4C6A4
MNTQFIEQVREEYSKNHYSAEKLANNVIKKYFKQETPKFPINIFEMLKDFGVFYEFRDFENLEGAYSTETSDYIAGITININRPFSRQRFTAAHELCHHIKDYDEDFICPQNSKDPKEQYANSFASNLLMPKKYFLMEVDKLSNEEGFVEPAKAFSLCHKFGTSYESVMWKLHNFGKLSFHLDKAYFKNVRVNENLGTIGHKDFLISIIDNYDYFPAEKYTHLWLKIQHELVFNDNRMEGLDIKLEDVAELLTDFRLKGKQSKYYENFKEKNRIEVIGHSFMYDYIKEKNVNEAPDREGLLELHKLLFTLSPFANEMGIFRKINNMISGAKIETSPHHKIEEHIYLVCKDVEVLLASKDELTISNYVSKVVSIHHELTKIHPFEDGNGRIIRGVTNWLLKLKKLPPVYIPYETKTEYVSALQMADTDYDFENLDSFFYKRLLKSFVILNEEFSLIFEDESEYLKSIS